MVVEGGGVLFILLFLFNSSYLEYGESGGGETLWDVYNIELNILTKWKVWGHDNTKSCDGMPNINPGSG